MRNQKGVSVIEVLIVVAIIGIIAAIAIPSLIRAKEHNQGMADFKVYFGVDLPAGDLSDEQKSVLKPFVAQQLGKYTAVSEKNYDAMAALFRLPPAQNSTEVQQRLAAVTSAGTALKSSQNDLARAQFAAKLRGLAE